MNRIIVIFFVCFITSFSSVAQNKTTIKNEKEIYKSWVLSRCLSFIANDEIQKQDALNTASAYLESSALPVDDFLKSGDLIQQYISLKYQGSIAGTFNTKKCIDLFNSNELNELYEELKM